MTFLSCLPFLDFSIWNFLFPFFKIFCKQFIMHEKWGHSMDNAFIFKELNINKKNKREKDPGGRVASTSYSAQPIQPYLSGIWPDCAD